MIDRLMSDVASALRGLRAAPAIPVAAVLTNSLAVAINLAMAGSGLLVSAAAMAMVLTVAIIATWLPAVTASKAEPNTLLRMD